MLPTGGPSSWQHPYAVTTLYLKTQQHTLRFDSKAAGLIADVWLNPVVYYYMQYDKDNIRLVWAGNRRLMHMGIILHCTQSVTVSFAACSDRDHSHRRRPLPPPPSPPAPCTALLRRNAGPPIAPPASHSHFHVLLGLKAAAAPPVRRPSGVAVPTAGCGRRGAGHRGGLLPVTHSPACRALAVRQSYRCWFVRFLSDILHWWDLSRISFPNRVFAPSELIMIRCLFLMPYEISVIF